MLFGDFAEARSRNFGEAIGEEEFAEDYGFSSDSDLEDEWDGAWAERPVKSKVDPIGPSAIPGGGRIECEGLEERVGTGKMVKIPDVAYVT